MVKRGVLTVTFPAPKIFLEFWIYFCRFPFWECRAIRHPNETLVFGIGFELGPASGGGVHRVAAGNSFSRQGDDEASGPAGWFVDRVIRAEELGSACHHCVASGGVVGAGLFGVGVGAGADEITFAHERGDVVCGTVVALDEGGIGLPGFGVGKEDAAAQGGVAGEVNGADRALVHEEDNFAAGARERGPVAGEDGFVQGVVVAANVIGRNHFTGREDRADLGIECVERGGGEGLGFGEVDFAARMALLGFDEDEDRDVARVGLRPLANLLEAGDEGLAGAAVVDVLNVHDFEAGLVHDSVGVEVGIRRKFCGSDGRRAGRVGVKAAFGVGIDVEFDLADPAVELLRKRLVLVVETFVRVGILRLPELTLVGRNAGVIAVVGSDDLNLVELDRSVAGLSLRC